MGGSGQTDGGTSTRLRGTLLTYLAEKKTEVFVVATANSILNLPPEMTRLGRWDSVWFVDLPNHTERKAIWNIHLGLVNQLDGISLDTLAERSNGFSGAEIEAVIQEALYSEYVPGQPVKLTTEKLVEALKDTVPLSTARASDLKELRDWAAANAKAASIPDTTHQSVESNKIGYDVTVNV